MAWTQDDLSKIDAALASGVKEVSYSGPPARKVTYQDAKEMLSVRSIIAASLSSGRRTIFYASHRSGY